jgi:hypothetical protein
MRQSARAPDRDIARGVSLEAIENNLTMIAPLALEAIDKVLKPPAPPAKRGTR